MKFGVDRDKACLRCGDMYFNHLRVSEKSHLYESTVCQVAGCDCVGWTRDVPLAESVVSSK